MKKIFSLVVISSVLALGCDYVQVPQQAGSGIIPTSDTIRKIFIEDFTGHTCPNCPSAARMIDSLANAFPGQIIGMGVHIDFFAEPCPPHGLPAGALTGTFTEDFRVPAEDADYNSVFGSNSFPLPAGLVNRSGFPASIPSVVSSWPSLVATILSDSMTAYIKINPSYSASTRTLNATVTGKFMRDTSGTFNIALYLVEDGLHGSQTDNTLSGGINNNYTFDHVFRGCINSPGTIGGAQIATGTILNGHQINYTMASAFTVSANFDDTKCKIIAILYNTADYGVLQAAECNLQ
jgi:thiol-disulfide isomerase/thioredoxin